MADQQFCLRWNNHQSTLVAVIDSLLENDLLVDCTLAAEGQYLRAHKVVLCACSPYLETLLSQHYEKHPIVILKDVKFQELKGMMDYMYKGEVNISQDQLGTFLKAAESLQIKGLTDGTSDDARGDISGAIRQSARSDHGSRRVVQPTQQAPTRSPAVLPPHSSNLTIEPSGSSARRSIAASDSPGRSREGSVSPTPRKRPRRHRGASAASEDTEHYEDSSVHYQAQSTPVPSQLLPSTSSSLVITKPPPLDETEQQPHPIEAPEFNRLADSSKGEMPSDTIVKSEYLEEQNDDDNVDLTLDDDDDLDGMDMGAGPSHSADNSNQGYSWPVGSDRSADEMFMSAQEMGSQRGDNQDNEKSEKTEEKKEADDDKQNGEKEMKKGEKLAENDKHIPPVTTASSSSSTQEAGATKKGISIKSSDGKVLTLKELREAFCKQEESKKDEGTSQLLLQAESAIAELSASANIPPRFLPQTPNVNRRGIVSKVRKSVAQSPGKYNTRSTSGQNFTLDALVKCRPNQPYRLRHTGTKLPSLPNVPTKPVVTSVAVPPQIRTQTNPTPKKIEPNYPLKVPESVSIPPHLRYTTALSVTPVKPRSFSEKGIGDAKNESYSKSAPPKSLSISSVLQTTQTQQKSFSIVKVAGNSLPVTEPSQVSSSSSPSQSDNTPGPKVPVTQEPPVTASSSVECNLKCGAVFKNKEECAQHCIFDCENRHTYKCDTCTESFVTLKELMAHTAASHAPTTQFFVPM